MHVYIVMMQHVMRNATCDGYIYLYEVPIVAMLNVVCMMTYVTCML